MTTKGKAYANRKSKLLRPKNDLYETPECLVEELINTGILDDCTTILDPCCGNYAITNVLLSHNKQVDSMDIMYGNDFLKEENHKYYDAIVMNPPFTLWDNFLQKAKQINCKKIIMIGKTDYFSCHGRNIKGLWNCLKYIYITDLVKNHTSIYSLETKESQEISSISTATTLQYFGKQSEYDSDITLTLQGTYLVL